MLFARVFKPGGENAISQFDNVGAPGAGDVAIGNVGTGTLNGPAGARPMPNRAAAT